MATAPGPTIPPDKRPKSSDVLNSPAKRDLSPVASSVTPSFTMSKNRKCSTSSNRSPGFTTNSFDAAQAVEKSTGAAPIFAKLQAGLQQLGVDLPAD